MMWALLGVVTAIASSALGAAVALVLIRRRTVHRPDTFPCRVRMSSGEVQGLNTCWSGAVHYGSWTDSILVLRHGVGLLRTQLLPVACAKGFVRPRELAEPSRLGSRVVGLTFVLDHGATIDVAVATSERELLPGPFLLAGLDEARTGSSSRFGNHDL